MQRFNLKPHPRDELTGPFEISATLKLDNDLDTKSSLCVDFEVKGDLKSLALPEPSTVRRRQHELWKATCFDVFVQTTSQAYREFNFAPSGDWACYQFSGYRAEMRLPQLLATPDIRTKRSLTTYSMTIHMMAIDLFDDPNTVEVSLGISAVLKTSVGFEYWAIEHCAQNPDFHHPKSFIAKIHLTSPLRTT